eukprot:429227_1
MAKVLNNRNFAIGIIVIIFIIVSSNVSFKKLGVFNILNIRNVSTISDNKLTNISNVSNRSRSISNASMTPINYNLSNNSSCYISQYSRDGIGHQIEAILSCLAVIKYYNNSNIKYLSLRQLGIRRWKMKFAHGTNQNKAKQFITFIENSINFSTNITNRNFANFPLKKRYQLRVMKCNSDRLNTIYRTDNCWKWTRGINPSLYYTNEFLNMIRNRYEKLPYFIDYNTIFNMKNKNISEINVVIHIRLGDAPSYRVFHPNYYYSCINVINNHFINKNIYFWIHTDGNKTKEYFYIFKNITNIKIFDKTDSEIDVFYALNQMVLADVFIMGASSLSMVAGLLNRNIVICNVGITGCLNNHNWITNNVHATLANVTEKQLNFSLPSFYF